MSFWEDRVRCAVDSSHGWRASNRSYTSIVYRNLGYILRCEEQESSDSEEQQYRTELGDRRVRLPRPALSSSPGICASPSSVIARSPSVAYRWGDPTIGISLTNGSSNRAVLRINGTPPKSRSPLSRPMRDLTPPPWTEQNENVWRPVCAFAGYLPAPKGSLVFGKLSRSFSRGLV
jgi:hypothetical protein